MVAKLNIRFIIAFGVLFGILYALLTPETFTSYRAQSVVINGATNPMTDAEIEKTLGVDKYLPNSEEEDNENDN
jgi:hypothetical protein